MRIEINVTGLDELEHMFANFDKKLERTTAAMVKAGSKEAVKAYKASIRAHGHVETGDMLESVGPGKLHENGGEVYQEVYPKGQDRRGVDNYLKAKRANFGTSKRAGSRFVDQAYDEAQEPVAEAMEKVFEKQMGG